MNIIIQYLCCLKIIIPVAGNYVLCLLDSLQLFYFHKLKNFFLVLALQSLYIFFDGRSIPATYCSIFILFTCSSFCNAFTNFHIVGWDEEFNIAEKQLCHPVQWLTINSIDSLLTAHPIWAFLFAIWGPASVDLAT